MDRKDPRRAHNLLPAEMEGATQGFYRLKSLEVAWCETKENRERNC